MKSPDRIPAEEHKERLKRLEAMSLTEWEEAVDNFRQWFEKVKQWGEAPCIKNPITPDE